jgi:cytochrome oxidase assembly protein ShyY1
VRRALAPRFWGVHLLAVVLVVLATWLGVWQLHAWQAKRAADAVDLSGSEPLPLAEVLGPDDAFPGTAVGQPVVLAGDWVPAGTVFVSGRESAGREGYWVVTPLAVGPGDSALLVVRGWTPAPEEAGPAPTGPAELVAWLQPPEGTAGENDDDPTDDVLPQVRIADAIQHVDQDLYGAYAVVADRAVAGDWPAGDQATNDGTAGLKPAELDERREIGRFTAIRNLFYALQWWLFGGFVLFVWWRHVTDTVRAEEAAAAAAAVPTDDVDHVPSNP